jgi:hypothetical protein
VTPALFVLAGVNGAGKSSVGGASERWDTARRNLVMLMAYVTELRVFDNSAERNAAGGTIPRHAFS